MHLQCNNFANFSKRYIQQGIVGRSISTVPMAGSFHGCAAQQKNVRLTRVLRENPVQVVATHNLLTYSMMLRVAKCFQIYGDICF